MTHHPPLPHPATQGFTLIEMLITLAVLGIILGIAAPAMLNWKAKLDADNFLASLASDLNTSRTRAMSTGQRRQIRLLDAKSYVVENQAVGSSTWTTVRTGTASSNVINLTTTSGRIYGFQSVGFVTVTTSTGTAASNYDITALTGTGQKIITVTALGLARRQ
ncbi:prepilin-type N-terminal cleavage/methylation domain-containing protein [Deinococcus sp.]|uniref:pilus assembly FimT family protein n=1 Tax=Deinococcus sp. TaxID=47478 RepID=UPI002869B9A2|nr:prepilin-type N-terminal cleavage/methylation domain-containing protein [Deinococcus sp.]